MATINNDILYAQELLEQDELVAIPTETVYGLAGNALKEAVVQKIFATKQRPSFDPLIVHTSCIEQAALFTRNIPRTARKLAEAFWPGPLTLILEKQPIIPDLVTSSLPTVGIRVPNHPLALQLLRQLSFPIAAPSANPFGYISPTTPQHVEAQLGEKIPYILQGGACAIGVESTIIGFENGHPVIYRQGGISQEAIEHITGPMHTLYEKNDKLKAPGMLSSHYAPRTMLAVGPLPALIEKYKNYNIGVINFKTPNTHIPLAQQRILSPTGTLEEAARNLFATLRALDLMGLDIILAAYVPNQGIGRAINDRLKRAAHEWSS